MRHSKIRMEILELLYNQSMRCASYVKTEFITKNVPENTDLTLHLNYLEKNGYIQSKYVYDGYLYTYKVSITAKGMHLIKNQRLI